MEKSIQKQLAKLPDKLAILKDDVYTHSGIDVSAMNDELLYVFLDKTGPAGIAILKPECKA